MSPAKKNKHVKARAGTGSANTAATSRWALAFYKSASEEVPARQFLIDVPQSVREMLLAIVVAVRDTPPPSFPPSRMWHRARSRGPVPN